LARFVFSVTATIWTPKKVAVTESTEMRNCNGRQQLGLQFSHVMAALRGGHPGRRVQSQIIGNRQPNVVIPAQAGIQASFNTMTTAKV
jgi:hypothetical protein